jgi:hypothetical protein
LKFVYLKTLLAMDVIYIALIAGIILFAPMLGQNRLVKTENRSPQQIGWDLMHLGVDKDNEEVPYLLSNRGLIAKTTRQLESEVQASPDLAVFGTWFFLCTYSRDWQRTQAFLNTLGEPPMFRDRPKFHEDVQSIVTRELEAGALKTALDQVVRAVKYIVMSNLYWMQYLGIGIAAMHPVLLYMAVRGYFIRKITDLAQRLRAPRAA